MKKQKNSYILIENIDINFFLEADLIKKKKAKNKIERLFFILFDSFIYFCFICKKIIL